MFRTTAHWILKTHPNCVGKSGLISRESTKLSPRTEVVGMPYSGTSGTGLDTTLSIIARLAQANHVTIFEEIIGIKGYSTCLFPMKSHGDTVTRHLVSTKDDGR